MNNHLFCFGFGYCAQALAKFLLAKGFKVTGTTRTPEKYKNMRAMGINALIWSSDNHNDSLHTNLTQSDHILISIAPDKMGDSVLQSQGALLSQMAQRIKWLGYLSTTGVYGDHQGKWVDETTPLKPTTSRGQYRVKAEAQWQEFGCKTGAKAHIFRLAGIYGPGRGPFAKIRAGKGQRIIKKGQVFSRIHINDIANILTASIANPNPGRVYNLCDDYPAPPQDVIAYAAKLLDMPLPPEIEFKQAKLGQMAQSFYAESKRVHNNRIKEELGITLDFPDYQTGLRAILNKEDYKKADNKSKK